MEMRLAFPQQADALTWKTGQQHLCFRPKQNSGDIQRPNIVKHLTVNSTVMQSMIRDAARSPEPPAILHQTQTLSKSPIAPGDPFPGKPHVCQASGEQRGRDAGHGLPARVLFILLLTSR